MRRRAAQHLLFPRRQQRQYVARRGRGNQIELIIVKLVLALFARFNRIDQKRFHLLYREIHCQYAEPIALEIKRNRRRHHLHFVLRRLIGKGLPHDAASRIIPLRLPGKPGGACRPRIQRQRLCRILQRLGGGKKAIARHVQHAFRKTTVVISQTQHIAQLKSGHELIAGKGIIAREKRVAVDKCIGNAIDRQRPPVMNLNGPEGIMPLL